MLQKRLYCPLDKRTGRPSKVGWPCDHTYGTLRWQCEEWWLFTPRSDGKLKKEALGADHAAVGERALTCNRCGGEFRVSEALRWLEQRRPLPSKQGVGTTQSLL